MNLFRKPADFDAFEAVLEETLARVPMRVLAYCLMPNHWHLVLWPQADGDLARFMQRLTITHVRRWLEHRRLVGTGAVYQGRFKSFPIEEDSHLLTAMRYVERNALRAGLVERAESWRWCSLWRRVSGSVEQKALLSEPPVVIPGLIPGALPGAFPGARGWLRWVNEPQSEAELKSLRRCVSRGQPLGTEAWVKQVTKRMGLESTFRARGRPKNGTGSLLIPTTRLPCPLPPPAHAKPLMRS
jgi:putative transposase